ncbi:hypothetical protein QUF74_06275 [Candidatus Halobeggiatoa sp. HSG11]|nr:hypothetical protein [Candidatus Halobeggiatoa sp. HSG11]
MNKLCIAISIFLWATFSHAETLFIDDFETGLNNWTGKNGSVPTAKVVNDPLNSGHGKVVTFTKKVIEGDIYTKTIISNLPINKPYILEFDYLGMPVRKSREGNGGYIGYSRNTDPGPGPSNHRWIGGTKKSYSIYRGDQYKFLKDNGKWNHYKVDLSATDFPDFVLMLEDYLYARGIAGDAYFDNILLTDARGPSDFELTVNKKGHGQVNSIPDGIDCNTDCKESYTDGTDVTLIVTPEVGSTFVNWQGDCRGNNNIIVTMDANKNCTAIFEKRPQLTIDKVGNGKVHSTIPGVNCGVDCDEFYDNGSSVTLIAIPNNNSTFIGWQDDCYGNENATITMNADKNCIAIFENLFQLKVNKKGHGQINSIPEGIDCNLDCKEDYIHGTDVTLIVTPEVGSTFVNWQGDCRGDNNIVVIMDKNKNCTAIFDKRFQLNVGKIGNGKVHSTTPGVNCGTDCKEIYNNGSTITLIATPDKNSTFTGWQGDCKGNKNATITIDANKNCTAIFDKRFQLNIGKIGNGKVHSTTQGVNCGTDCNEIYNNGSTVTLIATPDKSSTFGGWQGDCEGNKNATITIDANKNCTAIFDKRFQLNVGKIGNGKVHSTTPGVNCGTDCKEIYNNGSTVTLIATPDKNSTFTGWQGDCKGNKNATITIDANKNCTAIFDKRFQLNIGKIGNGKVHSTIPGINCGTDCKEIYNNGSTVTLIATPDKNSTFSGWQGDCEGNKNATITIDANKNCTAIFDKRFQLNIGKIGNGKVHSTTQGVNCGTDCNEIYNNGSTVTLIATPDKNSTFSGWQGDCIKNKSTNTQKNQSSDKTVIGKFKDFWGFGNDENNAKPVVIKPANNNPSTTVIMDADKTCTAKFTVKIPLTVTKSGNGNGLIKNVVADINCGMDCNESYAINKSVKLIATPDSNSVFIGWTQDCNGNNPVITVTMNTAKTCTANFKAKFPLKVNKIGDGNGQIVADKIDCGVNCSSNYVDGTEIMLTATPDENSIFTGWQDGCDGTDSSTNLVVDQAKTCTAIFEKVEYCKELPKAEVGMTFSAKFPDKPGKYYIIPADVAESCLKIVESSTVLIIEKVPECQPKKPTK